MSAVLAERVLEFNVAHLCSGIGFGALGFKRAQAVHGRVRARFHTLFGLDVDPLACRDFKQIVGAPCYQVDLFSREQYLAFHGKPPPDGWQEATADTLRRAAGGRRVHVLFWSPPCQGLSQLLNGEKAQAPRYQALNELVLRALDLALEAWADEPPALVLLENVPRIASRGRALLDSVKLRLELAGYACAETVHDCGELGGLAQHRERFLLVARHRATVRPFLYEPDRKPLRGVGAVVGQLPMPDDPRGGPMHQLPRLQWKTWVRLALIEAGSDWRSLNRLQVVDGVVRGLRLLPDVEIADPRAPRKLGRYQPYGVVDWDEPGHAVTGQAAPGAGPFSVADPRPRSLGEHSGKMRVEGWEDPAHTVTCSDRVGSGALSVADPRAQGGWGGKEKYITAAWDEPAGSVIAASTTGQGAFTVADPRVATGERKPYNDVFRVVRWDEAANAVTGGATPSAGGQSIADPRVACKREDGQFSTARHYGVLAWDEHSPTVTSSASHDNGAHSVADPRRPTEKCCPWIWSLDGTRHRPFTTLEHAALQGYPIEDILALRLSGSDSQRRKGIGNGVPVATAEAIGSTMLYTLLLQAAGQSFALSSAPIWVDRQTALALAGVVP